MGDAGAELRERTAGVDEGKEESLAVELGEMEGMAILIAEGKVGDGVTGSGHVVKDGGFVVGLGLGDDDDVVEEDVGVGVLRDEHVGGEDVAGMEFGEDGGVFELVGHGHGFHKAGDGFVVEGDLARGGIGGDDFSAEVVDLEVLGGGGLGGGGLAVVASGQQGEGEEEGGNG